MKKKNEKMNWSDFLDEVIPDEHEKNYTLLLMKNINDQILTEKLVPTYLKTKDVGTAILHFNISLSWYNIT